MGQFKDRVPADLVNRIAGRKLVVPVGDGEAVCHLSDRTRIIQFSLRSRDPVEIKARHAVAAAHVRAFWQSLREGPVRLTQRQVVALAGEAYREFTNKFTDDPGDPTRWEWAAGFYEHALLEFLNRQVADSSAGTGLPLVDRLLAKHGLVVDRDSIERLFLEIRRVMVEAAKRLQQVAEGDFRPDKNAERFPEFALAAPSRGAGTGEDQTVTALLEGWWSEAKASGIAQSTYVNYRGVVRKLVDFLGHDAALRVSRQEVLRFKDHRLASGVSPRTVRDVDLPALRTVFGWATANLRVPGNPAEAVTLKRVKTSRTRNSWFSDEEIIALLRASSSVQRGGEGYKLWLAKRWIPWVLAYTGARVGEIGQIRKSDLHHVGDHWELELNPEAGTVKGGHFRRVPLHPHLVEMGLPDVIKAAEGEHVFLIPNPDTGDVLGPLQGVKNRVTEFVRQHVTDRRVQPNHGWRHLFIYNARAVGIDAELRNMITGHRGQTVAAREYGGPAGLYREICKLPRFQV